MVGEHRALAPPQPLLPEAEEDPALTLLDAFHFDPDRMPHIVDDDRPPSEDSAALTFMLGDYSEKGRFPPSASVVRNEVLEGVPSSEEADAREAQSLPGRAIDGICFRCIHCRHADPEERAEMAVVRPQNLASLRQCFLAFERTHVQNCPSIPKDVRDCYLRFKAQEERIQTSSGAPIDEEYAELAWTSSAIRRGLRDAPDGGVLRCPELAARELMTPPRALIPQHPRLVLRCDKKPRPNDVLIGRGGLANKHPGNDYWRQLMKKVKDGYVDRRHGAAERIKKKSVLARIVVQAVRNQSPPGRFLCLDKDTGAHYEIGDKEAAKKTKQALRDMAKANHADMTTTIQSQVKQQIKKRMHHVLKPDAGKAAAWEKNEAWEINNLIKEEIGEWIDAEPTCLPPAKKQRVETPTKKKPTAPEERSLSSPTCVLSFPKVSAGVNWAELEDFMLTEAKDPATKEICPPKMSQPPKSQPSKSHPQKKNPPAKTNLNDPATKEIRPLKTSQPPKSHPQKKDPPAKTNPPPAPGKSGYNGVSKIDLARGHRYEARFSSCRLGSYVLASDAALAYDGFLRASGKRKHYAKINFRAEGEYLAVREAEVEARRGELEDLKEEVDLERVLEHVSEKVRSAAEKARGARAQ